MPADVISFSDCAGFSPSLTDREFDELAFGAAQLPGEWRVEKSILGGDCAYALLVPGGWGDGTAAAFDVMRSRSGLLLTDYRRTEFFGGNEDYYGTFCGSFETIGAICEVLEDLVGVKRVRLQGAA